ncbi:MAG: MoaD/ThiS family protein [Bacteroidota bacterium]
MQLLFFGSLTDIAGKADFDLSKIENTDQLKVTLFRHYPELANHSFLIAVNKKVQNGNVELKNEDVVALMPPFSGG